MNDIISMIKGKYPPELEIKVTFIVLLNVIIIYYYDLKVDL